MPDKIDVRHLSWKDALVRVKLPDVAATEQLGRDFAPTLHMDWRDTKAVNTRLRLALMAVPGTGKTSFFNGIASTLQEKPLNLDRREDIVRYGRFSGKSITQKWFHSAEMGHVCHVDTGFASEFWRILKPYRDDVLLEQRLGGVDIVENAETDARSGQFDVAVQIEKSMDHNNSRFRSAYIYATQEFAARPAFQKFLKSLENPENEALML